MNKRLTIELDSKSYDYFMEISVSKKRKKVLEDALKLYRVRGEVNYRLDKITSLLTKLQVYVSVIIEFSSNKKENNSNIAFIEKALVTVEDIILLLKDIEILLNSDTDTNKKLV